MVFTKFYASLNILLFIAFTSFYVSVYADEITQTEKVTISSNGISVTSIENLQGNITVKCWNIDSVKIETTTIISTSNNNTAEEIKDQLSFYQDISNKTINIHWKINKDYQFNIPVTVNYLVYIPQNIALKTKGSQGQLIIDNFTGSLIAKHELGSVFLNHISSQLQCQLVLKSCNAKITDINKCDVDAENSQIQIQDCKELLLKSSYCTNQLKNIEKLECISNYNKFNINNLETISFHGSNCHLDIQNLNKYGLIEISKGSLTIKKISSLVNELNISNKEAPVKLYLQENMPFFINGQNEQGGFIYPWSDRIRIITDLSTTSFSGQNGIVTNLSTKLILFNQLSVIQIIKE